MGQYKSQYTGPQIDAGINAALNPDLVPTDDSDALITSDAVAKVQQGFATIETAATSANSYAVGDLLVWGGILYKAKTSITAGDSFVVDTNIDATNIADKLNNIDTEITSDTDTTLTGLLTGNGSKVGTKSLDTSSLTNDADHVPVSSVVKSALTKVETDLASIHATGTTNTTGATIASGTYFYLNGALVRAKADIAVNATFTSGTNYETVTAGGLNDLKAALDVTAIQVDNVWTPTNCTINGSTAVLQGNILQLMLRVQSNATSGLVIQTPYKGYSDYAIFPIRSYSSPYTEIGTAWLSSVDGKLRLYGALAAGTSYYITGTAIVAL